MKFVVNFVRLFLRASQGVITLDQYGGIPTNDGLMVTVCNFIALIDALCGRIEWRWRFSFVSEM